MECHFITNKEILKIKFSIQNLIVREKIIKIEEKIVFRTKKKVERARGYQIGITITIEVCDSVRKKMINLDPPKGITKVQQINMKGVFQFIISLANN